MRRTSRESELASSVAQSPLVLEHDGRLVVEGGHRDVLLVRVVLSAGDRLGEDLYEKED